MAEKGANATVPEQPPDILSSIVAFFREHPALLGSLVYLQITSIGIIYSWSLYAEFGINIFDFAEANDFLLAAFKEPFAFIMGILTVLIFGGEAIYLMIRRRQRRSSVSTRLSFFVFGTLLIFGLAYTAFPAYFFARRTALAIYSDSRGEVRLRYKAGTTPSDFRDVELALIGTTEKFSFFYDKATENRLVVPISNIISIQFPPRQ